MPTQEDIEQQAHAAFEQSDVGRESEGTSRLAIQEVWKDGWKACWKASNAAACRYLQVLKYQHGHEYYLVWVEGDIPPTRDSVRLGKSFVTSEEYQKALRIVDDPGSATLTSWKNAKADLVARDLFGAFPRGGTLVWKTEEDAVAALELVRAVLKDGPSVNYPLWTYMARQHGWTPPEQWKKDILQVPNLVAYINS